MESQATPTREEIKEAVLRAGSSQDDFFHFPHKSDGLYLQQDPDEYTDFVHFMATEVRPSELGLDIGIASGGQTKFLRDFYTIKKTIILDDGQHKDFSQWARIRSQVNTTIVSEHILDSHSNEARKVLLPYQGQIDFAFIDGDHSYRGLSLDVELVKLVAKEGCIFIFHDTGAVPGCVKVFKNLQKDPDFEMLANFDRRFGISVFKYLAKVGPRKGLSRTLWELILKG